MIGVITEKYVRKPKGIVHQQTHNGQINTETFKTCLSF